MTDLWNKVMKEVKLGRYAGPFTKVPYDNYIQSPIGVVPKHKGTYHLSYPKNGTTSVNYHTPKEMCKVTYKTLDDAIRRCIEEGPGLVKVAKSDMTSAFRQLPLSPDQYQWLIMKAVNPEDNKLYYFVDKCLPFGSSISCAHFQKLSDALAYVFKHRTGKETINYLDDYFFVAMLKAWCDQQVQQFLNLCAEISFPVSMDKTFWGTSILTFLGLLVNTITQSVSIPMDKVNAALTMINDTIDSKKISIKMVLKLCGHLNLLCRAIVPGHAFTTRLYAPLKIRNKQGQLLKQHHHVRVSGEMKQDLSIWKQFLETPISYSRPFVDFTATISAKEICWFMDAVKNADLGFGGIHNRNWMIGSWDRQFMEECNPTIEYLELYAVLVSVKLWLKDFQNQRIILFCDNQSVVHMINNQSSKEKQCMVLLRLLVTECLICNSRVFARHVREIHNEFSDFLSRKRLDKFWNLARDRNMFFKAKSEILPESIYPPRKLWAK